MLITPIKTKIITSTDNDITKIILSTIPTIKSNSVLAITSKVIAITEGRLVPTDQVKKSELITQEADFFLPSERNKYHTTISVKNSILVASGGIDESNSNGHYVLWPKDPQASANQIRQFIQDHFQVQNIGIVITDSRNIPLRLGSCGAMIAHSGFKSIKSYIGQQDIFGRELHYSKTNVADAIATAAVLVMGEGHEQTPFATIEDIPLVEFTNTDPSIQELDALHLTFENDLFHEMLTSTKWETKKSKY